LPYVAGPKDLAETLNAVRIPSKRMVSLDLR
jgi:hypothetical protein